MLNFLFKSKDAFFYKVSSDLGEVNSFYGSFSDVGQKISFATCLPNFITVVYEMRKFTGQFDPSPVMRN